ERPSKLYRLADSGNLTGVRAAFTLCESSPGFTMPRPVYFLLATALPLVFGCGGPQPQFTIVVIPKGLTHEHWQSVRRGAERCAQDLKDEEGIDVRIIFDGPLRERDAVEQIRIVDRRVATGASAIVLAPQHNRTMTACVKRAA